jgi:hypothetical protein
MAILMRQTNAVWILFIAGTKMLAILQDQNIFKYVEKWFSSLKIDCIEI